MTGTELTILAVDDSQDYRELYSVWLGESHDVRTVPDGRATLAALDWSVDLVVLNREIPGLSGTEIARQIAESPQDPYVVMISSMRAEFDIADAPIDDYVPKPVAHSRLEAVVDQFQRQDAYHSKLNELFALIRRMATLEAAHEESYLADSEEYTHLKQRIAAKQAEVEETVSTIETDWSVAFKAFGSAPAQEKRSSIA